MSSVIKSKVKIDSALVDNQNIAWAKTSRSKEVVVILGNKLEDKKAAVTGIQIIEKDSRRIHLFKITNKECKESDPVTKIIYLN